VQACKGASVQGGECEGNALFLALCLIGGSRCWAEKILRKVVEMLVRKMVAEFVGTFALVFIGCGAIIAQSTLGASR
jgi:hypothetical protein